MSMRTVASRGIAALLILALQLIYAPAWAALQTASLSGRVLSADSQKPLAGVRVHVGDPRTGSVRSSAATAADGSFSVAGLPAASYELAIQSGSGLYVVPAPVSLASGESRNVHLAVQSQKMAPSPQEASGGKKDMGFWNNPLTATLIVLGAAIVVGVVVDEITDDDEASPN